MNGFFRRLALPAKLALLGLLPLLFLVVVVFQYNKEKDQKLALLDGYRMRIKQAVSINELIDILQMERRFSFVYATNNTLQTEMLQQRTRVDEVSSRLGNEGEETAGFESYTFLDQLKNV